MSGITNLSGVGSGIDFGVITDSLVAIRSRPITQLSSTQSGYRGRADVLKQLNTRLITLKEAIGGLTDRTLSTGRFTASSTPTVTTATAATTASLGTVQVEVLRLASQFSQATAGFPTTETAILANGATTATFELRKGGATTGTPLTITTANNSLAGLRDAINSAKAGVSASIVDVAGNGTQNQLVLTSTETGAAGSVELVETTSTGTGTALNLRSVGLAGANLDASLKINGLEISRPGNTISDALTGVSLSLKSTGTTTISITSNTSTLKSKIENFVTAYNAAQDLMNDQYKPDSKGRASGILAGNPTLRQVQYELRNLLQTNATGNGGNLTGLSQIGLGRDATGKITIDQETLNTKLTDSLADVQALFTGKTETQTGLAQFFETSVSPIVSTIEQAITGFQSSIQQLDKNIADQQTRLLTYRKALEHRFSVVDAAIGQINGQSAALTSVIKSLDSSKTD
ncbi:MAG TPA: flagellar filament capping protein FliD [Acidobacteriota bacterium]|nr:flagellar filament capping protein FliD [Acidobacteriota bacterium]